MIDLCYFESGLAFESVFLEDSREPVGTAPPKKKSSQKCKFNYPFDK
jgi:hypothetical protein